MQGMLSYLGKLSSVDINDWCVELIKSKPKDFDLQSLFSEEPNLELIADSHQLQLQPVLLHQHAQHLIHLHILPQKLQVQLVQLHLHRLQVLQLLRVQRLLQRKLQVQLVQLHLHRLQVQLIQ